MSSVIESLRFLKNSILNSKRNKSNDLSHKHHVYDVRELFFQENGPGGFNRFDMIVRLLAIENYYGKNTFGFDLYRRMQAGRMGKEWVDPAVTRFIDLIKSYEMSGYDNSSEITLSNSLKLVDGSHRMALAMYHNKYQISCDVLSKEKDIDYGLGCFIEYGFSASEIQILIERYNLLKNDISVPFVCTLWSPVQDYFDEIRDKLSAIVSIVACKDFEFNDETYCKVVKSVYAVDDIELWKIQEKLKHMNQHKKKRIRVLYLSIPTPCFRTKESNGNTLSQTCEKYKREVRNCYRSQIDDYFYDVIMHIGDNFYQNAYIKFLFDRIEEERLYNLTLSVPEFLFNNFRILELNDLRDFERQLDSFKVVLSSMHIDCNDVCIVGSSILTLLGLRENHDIDFVVTSKVRQNYAKGVVKCANDIEMVSENWARSKSRDVVKDDDLILDSKYHFIFNEIKFAKPFLLFERKVWQGRDKDIIDVLSMMKYASL